MDITVLRSPRMDSPAPESPVQRGNAASPAHFNSPRATETTPALESKQSSKERLEDARIQLGAARGLNEVPLSTRRSLAAVGLAMVIVLQVVASKAVLNAISSQWRFFWPCEGHS